MFDNLGWRPFWLHQGGEYLVGLVLVAAGMQSPTPTWPSVAGGLVLVNTALSGPPLGAFEVTSRALHRRTDLAVIAAVTLLAVQPWLSIASVSRLSMVTVAAIMALLWVTTRYDQPVRRQSGDSSIRSEELGRVAGRFVARATRAARNRRP